MLMATAQKDTNWRVRERAQTVLHFDAGHSAEAVAELMGLHVRTVSSTRTAWLIPLHTSFSPLKTMT